MKHIPGFGAESSLGPAMGMYMGKSAHFWTNRGFAAGIVSITPEQSSLLATIIGSDCFGSVDQCLDRFCVNLPPGKQRAECFAACQQPSVCSDCSCSCTPNCVRTCEVECTRRTTSGSAILKCTGSCVPVSGFPFPDNGSGTVSANP